MTKTVISDKTLKGLKSFLEENPHAELVPAYLLYLEKKFNLKPVVFPKEKKIYESAEKLIDALEKKEELWRETEIKIAFSQGSVNEDTSKIYICPFTGKVFGNNTHPNPQDAIYDWVSKCPENTERVDGMRVKRFFVSDDKAVISEYAEKEKAKTREPISKKVFSSVLNGKIFNSKQAVIQDFKKNYIKAIPFHEVTSQNRFEIEENFLSFIQSHLEESKIAAFVEALSEQDGFTHHVQRWIS